MTKNAILSYAIITTISAGRYVSRKISNLLSRNSSNREAENKEETQSYPVPTYVCPLNNGSHDNQCEHPEQHQSRNEAGRYSSGYNTS